MSVYQGHAAAENATELLKALLARLCEHLGVRDGALYLEDKRLFDGLDSENGMRPILTEGFVLAAITDRSVVEQIWPDRLDSADIEFTSLGELPGNAGTSVKVCTPHGSFVGLDSPRQIFCRGLFLFASAEDSLPGPGALAATGTEVLLPALPALEAVYRRSVRNATSSMLQAATASSAQQPQRRFANAFSAALAALRVEGGTLFMRRYESHREPLQAIATHPRATDELARTRYSLPDVGRTPTTAAMDLGRPVVISDVDAFRDRSGIRDIAPEPVWADIDDASMRRSILFTPYKTPDGRMYLLRATNSTQNPSKIPHVLNLFVARELTQILGLLHRGLENESRLVNTFNDISHDFRHALQGIVFSANYVRKTLQRKLEGDTVRYEQFQKLANISATTEYLRQVLGRFSAPVPPSIQVQDLRQPAVDFRPYADLVRPITAGLHARARRRRLSFRYFGEHQLGRVYASLAEWKTILENVVVNAVKYTDRGEEIQVAFERLHRGGGVIHVASKSVPISDEEADLLFSYGYRSPEAQNLDSDGKGLGLFIARSFARKYGGDVRLTLEEDSIAVFSVLIPKSLFRPAPEGAEAIVAEVPVEDTDR